MKIVKNICIILVLLLLLSLLLVGGAAAKSGGKVDVCHRTGNGKFVLINISSNALPAHLSHGDATPGDAVPGQQGMKFAGNCSVLAVSHDEQVQPVTVPPINAKGKPAPKVDVCHRRGNGTFILINISSNALPAHIAHGDALPGDWVPGQQGKKFTANCSIIELELVETFIVLPNGVTFSSQALISGQAYEIIVSGTFTYNPALDWADAEYYLKNGDVVKGDTEGSVPYVLDLSINGYSTNTDWGNYQSSHVYTKQWTGTGNPLSFSIFDSDWSDNKGSLTVEIWKIIG